MTATPENERARRVLKRWLCDQFPQVRSSHMDEAIAFSLGFRTYATLLAAMRETTFVVGAKALDTERFRERLAQLG